jgi:Programmed cell death protein 2, C-terminal putative domain
MAETHDDGPAEDNQPSELVQLGFSQEIASRDVCNLLGHRSRQYNCWDGGQIGGHPSWLQPQFLPNLCQLPQVRSDGSHHYRFICQLYAPIDANELVSRNNADVPTIGPPDRAYHRTLYVFGCRVTNQILVLRAQLPQDNPYFPLLGDSSLDDAESSLSDDPVASGPPHLPISHGNHVCATCGIVATKYCPKQSEYFCCSLHQQEYYSFHRRTRTRNSKLKTGCQLPRDEAAVPSERVIQQFDEPWNVMVSAETILPSIYPMYELVVEEEPPLPDDECDSNNLHDAEDDGLTEEERALKKAHLQHQPLFSTIQSLQLNEKPSEEDAIDSDDDTMDGNNEIGNVVQSHCANGAAPKADADLEQSDLNEMVSGVAAGSSAANANVHNRQRSTLASVDDPLTDQFQRRITVRPNVQTQVLRYHRWPKDDSGVVADDEGGGPLWIQSDYRPGSVASDSVTLTAPEGSRCIPNCQYCGAPRKFEFQLMPQLLHYLSKPSASPDSNNNADENRLTSLETAKAMLQRTEEIVHSTPAEHIPPGLIDARDALIQRVHRDLQLGDGEKPVQRHEYSAANRSARGVSETQVIGGSSNHCQELDWGIVAVYTCTASCGDLRFPDEIVDHPPERGVDEGKTGRTVSPLGAYRLEYAWVQPPL